MLKRTSVFTSQFYSCSSDNDDANIDENDIVISPDRQILDK